MGGGAFLLVMWGQGQVVFRLATCGAALALIVSTWWGGGAVGRVAYEAALVPHDQVGTLLRAYQECAGPSPWWMTWHNELSRQVACAHPSLAGQSFAACAPSWSGERLRMQWPWLSFLVAAWLLPFLLYVASPHVRDRWVVADKRIAWRDRRQRSAAMWARITRHRAHCLERNAHQLAHAALHLPPELAAIVAHYAAAP